MEYQQIRQALTDYFKAGIERRKQEILTLGRLDDNDKFALESSIALSDDALLRKDYWIVGRPEELTRFLNRTNLPITEGGKEYETLRTGYMN